MALYTLRIYQSWTITNPESWLASELYGSWLAKAKQQDGRICLFCLCFSMTFLKNIIIILRAKKDYN